MTAQITTLIEGKDNFELIRDQIAAILAVESANQQTLATADGQDPSLWKLRIFSERVAPFSEFINAPDGAPEDDSPIVNVWFDNSNTDGTASNAVKRQKTTGAFQVDCYGYGLARSVDGETGHTPGDEAAALNAQRAVRLCRRILMAGHYTYLGMRGIVWRRSIQSIESLRVPIDDRNAIRVMDMRLSLSVDFNEFSPQVQGENLEILSLDVKRTSTGEIIAETDFDFTA